MSERAERAAGRLEFVDALRGFALLGVCWANLLIFAGVSYMTDDQRRELFASPWDSGAYFFELFFIENKFMGLFSLLFGVSFWLFLNGTAARSGAPLRLFYRRIFWLFVIGLVHGWLIWSFDILRFYALWAVLLPLFRRTSLRSLLAVALSASVLVPALVAGIESWVGPPPSGEAIDALALRAFAGGSYADVVAANWRYDWYLTLSIDQIAYQVAVFGHLLLGLYVARKLDLGKLAEHRALLRRVAVAGALVGVVGTSVFTGLLPVGGESSPWHAFVRRSLVESGHLGLSLAYASGLALAYLTARGRPVVRALAPMGRMALTWYLAQTVIGVWIFYGFARGPALMGEVGPAPLVALCLVEFAVQAVLARFWLLRFRFGPAEWLWRSLTYGRRQPFRRAAEPREPVFAADA